MQHRLAQMVDSMVYRGPMMADRQVEPKLLFEPMQQERE